jgi:hypothetical protein
MKKKLSLIILICFFSFKSNSQCQNQSFGNKNYPGICVENTIKWFNMSRANWTTEMQKYDFGSSGFSEGAPFISSSDAHWDLGVQLVITKGFDMIQVENMPIGDFKKDIFQNIIGQLEPFFNRKSGNWNYFRFKYKDNVTYEFAINQSRMMDMIWIKKI